MKKKSIRSTLSKYLLVGTAVLLIVAGFTLDLMVRSWLEAEFDRGLEARAATFIALTDQEGEDVDLDFAPEFMPEFEREESPEYFQLWVGDAILEKSESLQGNEISRDALRSMEPRMRDVALPDGRKGRQIQRDYVPKLTIPGESLEPNGSDSGETVVGAPGSVVEDQEEAGLDPSELVSGSNRVVATIVVAKGRQDLDGAIGAFRLALGGVAIALIVAMGLLIRFVVPTGLRPLDEVASQVAALDADSLSRRIAAHEDVEEITPLVEKLNLLLDRLHQAFERERRFSSDVSHELRTPVAELKNLAEVGSRWPEDRESVRQFFDDVRDVSESMERTIGNLLSLARCDAGIEEVVDDDVHLATTIDRLWRMLERDAEARDVHFASEVPSNFVIRTDPAKLELILLNLLSNAVTYSPRGATVRCLARNGTHRVTVSIANPVEHLTEDDLVVMFDRFWRKDAARTPGDHSGLGLALVRALSDLLAFQLDVALEDKGSDRWFRVSISTSTTVTG